jgi:glycosyltransferase involved in cell wall biosynthesis
MHIDQVVIGATPGDAVTESAFRIRNALRHAVESDIYALHADPRLEREVGRLDRYPMSRDRTARDVIIYHMSIGDDRVTDLLLHRAERLVLVYHNVTPSVFFRHFDPHFAELLETGRRSLPTIVERASCVIAHSEFNAADLRTHGATKVHVTPPPLNLGRLTDVEPDPAFVAHVRDAIPNEMVLFVGQVLPHKRPDLLVSAHHLLVSNYRPSARLVVAGPDRNRIYSDAFRSFIDDLALDTVWFTGELTDAQLAALYRRADVVVTASEHEGFCVPIVEAFHFDVPVVARAFGAIPETAGDGALVLPASSDARHLAEAVHRVLGDKRLRDTLIASGRERRRLLSADRTLASMLRILRDVAAPPGEVRS